MPFRGGHHAECPMHFSNTLDEKVTASLIKQMQGLQAACTAACNQCAAPTLAPATHGTLCPGTSHHGNDMITCVSVSGRMITNQTSAL